METFNSAVDAFEGSSLQQVESYQLEREFQYLYNTTNY